MRRACIGVFVLVLGVACASTPKLFRSASSPYVDAWLEWDAQGEPRVRVAVSVGARELLHPGASGAPDLMVATAVLSDGEGRTVASEAWRHPLPAVPDTPATPVVQEHTLDVDASGRYRLRLGVLVRGRVLVSTWERTFQVPDTQVLQPRLSEPRMLVADGSQAQPAHVYEEGVAPRLRASVWLPPEDFRGALDIAWLLHDEEQERFAGIEVVGVRTADTVSFDMRLPATGPGTYRVTLGVETTDAEVVGVQYQVVPRLHTSVDSLPSDTVARVVLSNAEWQRYGDADPAARWDVWNGVLETLLPGRPEQALELLGSRWRQASVQFAEPGLPGWRAPRGRVYIRRGAPQQRERLQDPNGTGQVDRWRYVDSNHVFVFRDARGTGNFVLERTNDPSFP